MTGFKVGDRVKVIGNTDPDHLDSHVGDTGTVVEIGWTDNTYGGAWDVESDTDGEVRTFFEGELSELEG